MTVLKGLFTTSHAAEEFDRIFKSADPANRVSDGRGFLEGEHEIMDVYEQDRGEGAPAPGAAAHVGIPSPVLESQVDNLDRDRDVWIIHGRNQKALAAMQVFLSAIGLRPKEWNHAIIDTKKATPSIPETVLRALKSSAAIVVLLTGDETASLRKQLGEVGDPELDARLQPRQNVLIEAGMAWGLASEKVFFIRLGEVGEATNFSGLYIPTIGDAKSRNEFANRLKVLLPKVDLTGSSWLTAGDFQGSIPKAEAAQPIAPQAAPTQAEAKRTEPLVKQEILPQVWDLLMKAKDLVETNLAESRMVPAFGDMRQEELEEFVRGLKITDLEKKELLESKSKSKTFEKISIGYEVHLLLQARHALSDYWKARKIWLPADLVAQLEKVDTALHHAYVGAHMYRPQSMWIKIHETAVEFWTTFPPLEKRIEQLIREVLGT